jgi:hypothetical protein
MVRCRLLYAYAFVPFSPVVIFARHVFAPRSELRKQFRNMLMARLALYARLALASNNVEDFIQALEETWNKDQRDLADMYSVQLLANNIRLEDRDPHVVTMHTNKKKLHIDMKRHMGSMDTHDYAFKSRAILLFQIENDVAEPKKSYLATIQKSASNKLDTMALVYIRTMCDAKPKPAAKASKTAVLEEVEDNADAGTDASSPTRGVQEQPAALVLGKQAPVLKPSGKTKNQGKGVSHLQPISPGESPHTDFKFSELLQKEIRVPPVQNLDKVVRAKVYTTAEVEDYQNPNIDKENRQLVSYRTLLEHKNAKRTSATYIAPEDFTHFEIINTGEFAHLLRWSDLPKPHHISCVIGLAEVYNPLLWILSTQPKVLEEIKSLALLKPVNFKCAERYENNF